MQGNTEATPVLIARRKAAAVLNHFVRETLGMGTMGERFNGDADDDWAVIDESEIKALRYGRLVAIVTLRGDTAILAIPEERRLAIPKHQADFNAREFGFMPRKMNWRKEREPYLITLPIPDSIPGLFAPKRPVPAELRVNKVHVRRRL